MSLRPQMTAASVARRSSAPVRSRTPLTSQLVPRRPLGFDAGDANLYRYVRNNPARNGDPLGLDEKDKRANPEDLLKLAAQDPTLKRSRGTRFSRNSVTGASTGST